MLYIISLIVELVLELILELIFSLGFRRINDIFKHTIITSIIFGILSGFVSLLFFQEIIISDPYLQIANLLVTPVTLGIIMFMIGRIYDKLGMQHSSLDNFSAGFSFGMAMTLVRYLFGV